jgi:hypothetical protein
MGRLLKLHITAEQKFCNNKPQFLKHGNILCTGTI